MQKKSLGKGLGALISGAARRWDPSANSAGVGAAPPSAGTTTAPPGSQPPPAGDPATWAPSASNTDTKVQLVPVTYVVSSPMQPRKSFHAEQIEELVNSIREHGIIQPLVVRLVRGKLELIAGERRFRAAQQLGLAEVPVLIREATDREVLEMALIENLQREDLNPLEEADAYSRLAGEFNMTQEQIAQRVGKNRATVANSLRLLELPDDVKSLVSLGRLSAGHAKAILGLRDAAMQCLIADMVVRKGLTVRMTEEKVKQEMEGRDSRPKKSGSQQRTLSAHIARLQSRLRDRLATHVQILHGPKKGKIEVEYYGDEDLGRILELLGVHED
jgi:ParB family chromosome partitioning protein